MIATRKKFSAERRSLQVDFSGKLGVGDGLLGALVSVAPAGALLASVLATDAATVIIRLVGGTDGADYGVHVQAATAHGDVVEESVTIEVRDA